MSSTIHVPADCSVTGAFTIRTQSRRRYIVIDTKGRFTAKRTNDVDTAWAVVRRGRPGIIVWDQVGRGVI